VIAPSPIDRSRIRPSLVCLGLAPVPVVAGIVLAVVIFVNALHDVTGSFRALDGPVTVRLDEDAGRGIWARTDQEVSGFCSAIGPRPAQMKETHNVTVTTGDTDYYSFLNFRAPVSGEYRIDCAASQPLSLGPYVTGGRILAGIGGVLGSFFGGLLLGGLVLGGVLLARERSKRRLELEAQAFR
jgi:hypothetical protein